MIGKAADRIRKPIEQFKAFFNSRSPREKIMILALTACFFLALDYFILIAPVIDAFDRLKPQVILLREEKASLLDDGKNGPLIEKKWRNAKSRLDENEKRCIAPDEIPALLENLSQLALGSEVKIISLKPLEGAEPENPGPYRKIPIKISAIAGAHELGRLLARLESGTTFFKIIRLDIRANPMEIRRHVIEMDIEAVRRL